MKLAELEDEVYGIGCMVGSAKTDIADLMDRIEKLEFDIGTLFAIGKAMSRRMGSIEHLLSGRDDSEAVG